MTQTTEERIQQFSFMKSKVSQETKEFFKNMLMSHPDAESVKDLSLAEDVDISRLSDFWYNGVVATIEYEDYSFDISAEGDQRYSLYIKDFDKFHQHYKDKIPYYDETFYRARFEAKEALEHFVNKGGGGDSFLMSFGQYFSSDEEFNLLTTSGVFDMCCDNNNWLDTFCKEKSAQHYVCLTDIFIGFDIGDNIGSDVQHVLDMKDVFIEHYKTL